MDLDDKICYCFHVSRRKLVNFLRQRRPKVASQLSECGGAGTGCGWCIPFLKQIYQHGVEGGETELERLTPAEYEKRRELHRCRQRRNRNNLLTAACVSRPQYPKRARNASSLQGVFDVLANAGNNAAEPVRRSLLVQQR
jgi:bacterioferritin-associated ferredoxin